MQPIINQHHLQAADVLAMQQALSAKGIEWDGEKPHLLCEANGQQVELVFMEPYIEVSAEGFHANAVSRGAEPFDFGDLEIQVANPKVRWAGVGGEDVE